MWIKLYLSDLRRLLSAAAAKNKFPLFCVLILFMKMMHIKSSRREQWRYLFSTNFMLFYPPSLCRLIEMMTMKTRDYCEILTKKNVSWMMNEKFFSFMNFTRIQSHENPAKPLLSTTRRTTHPLDSTIQDVH